MVETVVDLAARKLGIDPVELRRRNTIPPGAMPFKTGLTFTYDNGEFEKNMDMALAIADAKDPHAIHEGQELFAANCAACHGAKAKGLIGPNLTDKTWLYGGKPQQIAHTIANGTAKGMPSWKNHFTTAQIADLAAFVHALGGGQ